MSWAWALPTAIAAIGVVATSVVAWHTAREASGLREELDQMRGLRPALVEARDDMAATAAAVRRMHPGH